LADDQTNFSSKATGEEDDRRNFAPSHSFPFVRGWETLLKELIFMPVQNFGGNDDAVGGFFHFFVLQFIVCRYYYDYVHNL